MIIKFKRARLAFPQLFQAKAFEAGGKEDFSGTFLFAPDHPQVAEIVEGMQEVARLKWGDKAAAIYKELKEGDKLLLHNGNRKASMAGFEGNLYISARNSSRPLVVDRDGKTPLVQADGKPYAGCYVNFSFEIWAQQNNYGKRINATLRGVQFLEDGEAFAGGGTASDDEFADLAVSGDLEDVTDALADTDGLF